MPEILHPAARAAAAAEEARGLRHQVQGLKDAVRILERYRRAVDEQSEAQRT